MHPDAIHSGNGITPRRGGVAMLIENRWRFTSPSGRILTCGIYDTAGAFEVRVSYRNESPFYARRSFEIDTARSTARELRLTVVAKGCFTELPL
jgi:hypothetical protein